MKTPLSIVYLVFLVGAAKEIHTGNKLVARHSDNLFKPKIHPPPATSAAPIVCAALSTFLLFVLRALPTNTPQPQPPRVAPAAEQKNIRDGEREKEFFLLQTNERTNGVLVFWS
jgi:hypothetical protein